MPPLDRVGGPFTSASEGFSWEQGLLDPVTGGMRGEFWFP